MLESKITAAIKYAHRGWVVHKLHSPTAKVNSPGKQPVDKEWQKVTTRPTEEKLRAWFGNDNPKAYNIGLVCGAASNVTVIDLDRMIYADIFDGVNTLRSSRTAGRGHVFFKYTPRLKAIKRHNLGIEVLTNGNNVVLPPSIHVSGEVYHWEDPDAPIAEMPEEVETRLINLVAREEELNKLVEKCRPCFSRLFGKKIRETIDFHGAEGRELMVAWGADLKAAGATLSNAEMWAKILYGDLFDRAKTLTEWRHIDEKKTWRCEIVVAKLGSVINCDCERCKWKAPAAPKRVVDDAPRTGVDVLPDEFLVGDRKVFDANRFAKWLLDGSGFTFVTLLDTGEVLWYDGGVYRNRGDVEIMKIVERVMDGFKVTKNVVNEVIGHVQRRTYIERDEFDGNKHIVNLKNGLYNARTGELKPHTPDYLSTVQILVAYDPAARCPVIDRFLSDVLDADDIETAIEWCGYVLEPDYWIQSILMLLGEGGNGKSTFLSLLSAVIGKRNVANESIHSLTNNRFRVAKLHGKLANIYADVSDNELKETGVLKLLSGGDSISAEKKNTPPFEFKNFARLIFSANRLPPAWDDTDAWYRRWTFINFTRKFCDDPDATKPADPKLLGKLTTDKELSGLLNRALEALDGLHERGGFSHNLSTGETRRIYTRLSDPVAVFIEDCCIISPENTITRSALFNAYVRFCEINRQAPIGQSAFTRRLRDRGRFSDCQVGGRNKRERGWRGLNIDRSIFNEFGDTLGDTLVGCAKTLSSGT